MSFVIRGEAWYHCGCPWFPAVRIVCTLFTLCLGSNNFLRGRTHLSLGPQVVLFWSWLITSNYSHVNITITRMWIGRFDAYEPKTKKWKKFGQTDFSLRVSLKSKSNHVNLLIICSALIVKSHVFVRRPGSPWRNKHHFHPACILELRWLCTARTLRAGGVQHLHDDHSGQQYLPSHSVSWTASLPHGKTLYISELDDNWLNEIQYPNAFIFTSFHYEY